MNSCARFFFLLCLWFALVIVFQDDMEDTPLSMYSYWRRWDWSIFGTKLLSVKLRGWSGGRENQASPRISTKHTDFWEAVNCKFPNCSHGRTWLNLWQTTNEEISNVGLVMAAPIRSVTRDCKFEIFLLIFRSIGSPLIYFFSLPELSAWMIPTWTRIKLDTCKETLVSFSPQHKHRIADNQKKGGSGRQCNSSIIDRADCLFIALKRLHFTSLQVKEILRNVVFWVHSLGPSHSTAATPPMLLRWSMQILPVVSFV